MIDGAVFQFILELVRGCQEGQVRYLFNYKVERETQLQHLRQSKQLFQIQLDW